MASTALNATYTAASEPLITGSLLYILTRGPSHIRDSILQPFRTNLLKNNGPARVVAVVGLLKILTVLGIGKRINQALNRFALNGWTFRRAGPPFKFGPTKEELVFITGGSSGFGYEMVKTFSKHARVVAIDISPFPPELESLPGVQYYRCDVTDTPALVSLCEEVRREHGDPTVLINNAGVAVGKTVLETTNEETQRLFQINLISHFVLIREFLPAMLRQGKGHIVTIASMASFVAVPGLLDYSCSKIGALYLSDGIRAECLQRYPGGEGIRTTSVHPSWHATGIIKGVESTLRKHGVTLGVATDVSDRVVDRVLKGRSGILYIPSSHERLAGLRFLPTWTTDLVYGLVWKKKQKESFLLGSSKETTLAGVGNL
ncbi:NAD(P)-binding protein [Massarina eburnea CBS 473.64]|uniref:NAD(P)-binding protein n=1 Tax=Massarina eburnea CBS 473.64 TaxID=1395130 RepID=A0A6A6RM90_9PLEO|nr:NAD(P)-binding protein [Massarina eburnea CBS 473.64]